MSLLLLLQQSPPPTGYPAAILGTSGLVSYWRLGEPSGNPQDTKNGNHVSAVTGAPTYGVTGAVVGTDKAMTFNGSTDYLTIPDDNSLDFGDGPFTIEFWMKLASTSGTQVIWFKGGQGDIYYAGGTLWMGNTGADIVHSSNTIVDTTTWHHIVLSRVASGTGNTKLYIDGVDVTVEVTISAVTASNTSAMSWGVYLGVGLFYAGSLDELAVYNVALSAADVTAHYNAGLGLGGAQTVTAVGAIASGEAVGTPAISVGGVTVTAVGAIASGEAVGTPAVAATFSQTVTNVGGIASAESFSRTFIPATGTTGGTADAYLGPDNRNESWATLKARTSADSVVGTGGLYGVRLQASASLNQYASIYRGLVTIDVSALAGRAVGVGTIRLFHFNKSDGLSATPSINLYKATPSINDNFALSDYGTIDLTTPYSTAVAYASWPTVFGTAVDFVLNAAGIAALSAAVAGSGIFAFGVANANYDAANTPPPWVSGGTSGIQFLSRESGGTSQAPTLIVDGPVVSQGGIGVSAVGAIASGEAVGTPSWTGAFGVTAVGGIASGEAVGTPSYGLGVVVVTAVGGIASGEALGNPTAGLPVLLITAVGAIASAEGVGTPTAGAGATTLTAVGGIASGEALGTPSWTSVIAVGSVGAIASLEALGIPAAVISQIVTAVGGIASLESVGSPFVAIVVHGPAPRPPSGAVEYVLELFTSGATFGPATKTGEIWDARNLGWSRYDRLPGKAFVTLYQDSPHLSKFSPLITHARITRVTPTGDTELWNGVVIDYDSTGDDVVISMFDYVSLFSVSRSGYKTLYPRKKIGTEIVGLEASAAITKQYSPLGFITLGTIEDPLGNDGLTSILTNQEFGLLDQSRLQVFFDLSEMGRANTKNHVTFQVTRTAPFTFYFLKAAGVARDIGLTLNGTITDYEYLPNWSRYRNDIATLGTTVGGGATEIIKTDEAAAAARGRRQDVATIKTLLGIVTATTEQDQQQAATARILNIATQRTAALSVRLERGTLAPFDGWDIADTTPVEIVNGVDNLVARQRIVGVRGLYTEAGEDLSIVLEPILL